MYEIIRVKYTQISTRCMLRGTHTHICMTVTLGFLPSCAVWPIASHPDWSVCIPWSCIETKAREGEKEKGNEELIHHRRPLSSILLAFGLDPQNGACRFIVQRRFIWFAIQNSSSTSLTT